MESSRHEEHPVSSKTLVKLGTKGMWLGGVVVVWCVRVPLFCLVIINNLCPIKLHQSLNFLYLNEKLCSDETS